MSDVGGRYIFIDILKGISILLVVYGHVIPGTFPIFTEYAGTFRMPLFFFVSGILFNDAKYKHNFKDFIYRRYKGLVIPFFWFSIIVALCYSLLREDYCAFLLRLATRGWEGYALWFIPVLFGSQLLFYPLCKLEWIERIPFVLLFGVLSFFSSKYIGFIPYNIGLCFCGAFFFGMGNVSKKILTCTSKFSPWSLGWGFLVGFILSCSYKLSDCQPEWASNDIPSFIFLIAPLGSIVCLSIIALIIEKKCSPIIVRFFSTCGKQSYIILAFHQIICMLAQHLPSKVVILIMVVVLTFLVWFIPKYLPWMLGKAKA